MFEIMNPLGLNTAILEIIIMCVVSFLIGWLLCRLLGCCAENECAEAAVEEVKQEAKKPQEVKEVKAEIEVEDDGILNKLSIGSTGADKKDDLKLISGVGPFIEDKLNKIGITSFEQVANLSDEDIKIVEDCLLYTSPSPRDA